MDDRHVLDRRTRRRMRLGAILAVLVVVVSIPLLRTDPETRLIPAPDLSTTPRTQPMVYDMDFADERHGFALFGKCAANRCQSKLLSTEDGETWVATPFADPKLAAPERLTGRIVALGSGRIMITDVETRFYSNDSGRTWSRVQLAASQTVAEIPVDGMLETECVDEAPVANSRPACLSRQLVVTLPDTGERALLARPPNIENPTPEGRAADDGSWWVSGRESRTGRWVVATSRDAGRTWSNAPLPVPSGLVMNTLSGTGSGANRYLLATGWLPDAMEPKNLVAIFRSADGGAHWQHTWRGTGDAPRTLGGTAIVTADGGLVIAPDDVGPSYRSLDGGASFAPNFDGPRLTSVRRTRVGYLAAASDRPLGHYVVSADGVHWTPVRLP